MIGVMLAGGKATRLPNKPLLPTRHNGLPMAVNAARQLLDNGMRHIVVVRNPKDKALEHVLLNYFGACGPMTLVDDDYAGVTGAIAKGCAKINEDLYAVFCCDNIYPDEKYPAERGAYVRHLAPDRQKDLDLFDTFSKEYCPRGGILPNNWKFKALTTPWIIDSHDAQSADAYTNVLDWLNSIRLPARHGAPGWDDLGTPQAYEDYWNQP